MSDLRELYQEVILDHNRKPRNFGKLESPDRVASGHNPLCGDRLQVGLNLEHGTIKKIAFEGSGCAISKASASLMTESVLGKSVEQAKSLFHQFQSLVTGEKSADDLELGKLAVFAGVCEFPARVKCASLAWHTLNAALSNDSAVISTEGSDGHHPEGVAG